MRVLLLDEGFTSGCVTVRGLVDAGCHVDVVAATGGSGACDAAGNHWQLAPRVGDPRLPDVIDGCVRAHEYDVIYPITEPLQWLLWDTQPAWLTKVFPHVDERRREQRRDKGVMSDLMARSGVLTPRQMPLRGEDDLVTSVEALGIPIVVKGAIGRGGSATRICASVPAARRAAEELSRRGHRPFAQAFVAGQTCLAGGLFARGRALRFYAGLKTCQFPAGVGPAAEISSFVDPELIDVATRVFAAADVTGLASIDLIKGSSGGYHFLELNPRPWGSMGAAKAAGVDVFKALVALWQSRSVEPCLEFMAGVRTPIFPLYLLAGSYWHSGAALRALGPDLRRVIRMAHAEPALAGHVLHRLVRVGLNWPSVGTTRSMEIS